MHRRNAFSTAALAASLAATVMSAGCRDQATTGPSKSQSKDFAAALRAVQGNQQVGGVGAALSQQLVVKVVDANGQPVSGASVTFTVRAGGGAIVPPANTSNDTGFVRATWILGTSLGANTAVALLTNGFVLDSALFSATATSGTPSIFTRVSGNNQIGRAGKPLAVPLIVKLTDAYGYTKSGVKVTWTGGALGGTLLPLADTTAADGTAQATWTLGSIATPQASSATVAGLAPIVFNATTQPDTGRMVSLLSGANQTGPVAFPLPTPVKVKVTDQYGNPIVGEIVTWGDSIGGGGSVSPTTSTTLADGTAQATWTLGNHAGIQSIHPSHQLSSTVLNLTATATVAFSDVFAGNFQACGIVASNQRVFCWGNGDAGQLAKGNIANASAPTSAASTTSDTLNGPFLQVRQMAGGRDQFCAISVARSLYCWGRIMGASPVNVATRQDFTTGGSNGNQQILLNYATAGQEHICLMSLAGDAFCTGVNYHGQLGDGAAPITPAVNTYVFVLPFNFLYSSVSAGRSHTCGVPRYNPASATSQVPRCWGLNTSGQVGNGTLTFADATTPQAIKLPLGVTAFDSTTITAGAQHSCAIAIGGAAYCWGNNGFGQLGKGVAVTAASRDSVPQAVAGGLTFAKISAGEFHTCAITLTGAAYCWGLNDHGQLGDGTRTNQVSPVAVTGGLVFRSVSVGELYTCGLVAPLGSLTGTSASPGTIYCWGDNLFGQLGIGTSGNNAPVLAPTRVLYQP